MSKKANKKQSTDFKADNNSEKRDNLQNDSVLIDTTRQLLLKNEFKEFERFFKSLDFNTVRRLAQNEDFLEMFLKFKLHQGCWLDVIEVLKTGKSFTKPSFLKLWDEANYQQYQSKNSGDLTPVIKYRLRHGNPPPESICPAGKRPTRILPTKSVNVLQKWFNSHKSYPYPCLSIKSKLAKMAGISIKKVSTWFQNARRKHMIKIKKPKSTERNQSSKYSLNHSSKKTTSSVHCEVKKSNSPNLRSSSQVSKGDNLPLVENIDENAQEETDTTTDTELLKDNETERNSMYVYLNPFNEADKIAMVTEYNQEQQINNVHLPQGHENHSQGHNSGLVTNGPSYFQLQSPSLMPYPEHSSHTQVQACEYPGIMPTVQSRQVGIDQSENGISIPTATQEMVTCVSPNNLTPVHCTMNPNTCVQCHENHRQSYYNQQSLCFNNNHRYMPYRKVNTQNYTDHHKFLYDWKHSWKFAKHSATSRKQEIVHERTDASWRINECASVGNKWNIIDSIPSYILPYTYIYPRFFMPAECNKPNHANMHTGINSLQHSIHMKGNQRNTSSHSEVIQSVQKVMDYSSSQRKDKLGYTVPNNVRQHMNTENVSFSENFYSRPYNYLSKDKSQRQYCIWDECHTRVTYPAIESLRSLQKLCNDIETTVQSPIDYVVEVCHEMGEELCCEEIQEASKTISTYYNDELQSQNVNFQNEPIDMTLNEASNISESESADRFKQSHYNRDVHYDNMVPLRCPDKQSHYNRDVHYDNMVPLRCPEEVCYNDINSHHDLPVRIQRVDYQPMELHRTELQDTPFEDSYPGVIVDAVKGLLNMSSSQESELPE